MIKNYHKNNDLYIVMNRQRYITLITTTIYRKSISLSPLIKDELNIWIVSPMIKCLTIRLKHRHKLKFIPYLSNMFPKTH